MKIESAYLLLGPENGEKAAFIKQLKNNLRQAAGELEEYRFYPFETEINEVIGLLQNGSLFSDHKVVTLYQVETLTKKQDIEPIVSYLRNPAESATLLLVSDEVPVDKRLRSAVTKNSTKIFWEMFENRKKEWIQQYFQKNKIEIEGQAVELILELVENNTLELKRECNRLVLFFNDRERLTAQDVEDFIYHSKEENVFSLFEKIARKELSAALEASEKILLSGESDGVQLAAGLIWQFKKLLGITLLTKRKFGFEEACKQEKIRSKRIQRTYQQGIQNYSVVSLERIISLLAYFDFFLRASRTEIQRLLVSLMVFYCVRKEGVFPRDEAV